MSWREIVVGVVLRLCIITFLAVIFVSAVSFIGMRSLYVPQASVTISPNASDCEYAQGETFILTISTTSVSDLYSYGFRLNFNPFVLNAIAMYPSGGLHKHNKTSYVFQEYWVNHNFINNDKGYASLWVESSSEGDAMRYRGTLARITFQVMDYGKHTSLTFDNKECGMFTFSLDKIVVNWTGGSFTSKYCDAEDDQYPQ